MALGNPIQLRLSLEKHLAYEDEAQRQGKPLATYLRDRLEDDDAVRAEIAVVGNEVASLRREVAGVRHKIDDKEANGEGYANMGVKIETLLLLRANTAPDKMTMIHAELRRLGFDVWTYNNQPVRC